MWDHPANAASRIGKIFSESRNQVDMQVRHSLASSSTIVDADVIAIGPEFLVCRFLGFIQEIEQCRSLRFADLEERADMALRNDQTVPRRYGKAVTYPKRVIVLTQNPGRG